ncbi:NAD(P)-binding domain-containing protein [Streptomyces cheonanensis]|uniref:NAD(P)-binding domain-containing protein n=1 Tax=Streptomyces cheonanensis TaxID=312720 RepID=A0ABN2VCP3_9ACTN
MRIGILGAGGMADALGTQWVRAGHEVLVSGRDPAKARALAARIGPGAYAGSWAEAAGFGEVVLLAVRAHAVPEVLAAAGDLTGRTLIDCTNAVVPGAFTLATAGGPGTAERIARQRPGAHVVKAFNLNHVDIWRMRPPAFGGAPLGVPVCGDDPAALALVRTLITDIGCTPVDGGPLERAGLLEATAAFVIGVWAGGADVRGMFPPADPGRLPDAAPQAVPGSR